MNRELRVYQGDLYCLDRSTYILGCLISIHRARKIKGNSCSKTHA
jgi:hypothetical protein